LSKIKAQTPSKSIDAVAVISVAHLVGRIADKAVLLLSRCGAGVVGERGAPDETDELLAVFEQFDVNANSKIFTGASRESDPDKEAQHLLFLT
jgi:hypothetical protein